MDKFVIASLRPNAGKTSVIVGLSKALGKRIAYIKPFGERFLYKKKRLWDYDAALMTQIFGLEESPEDMSIGFHHSKLLFMLDERGTHEKIQELIENVGNGKDLLFVECGKDLTYGASIHLDALSLARQLDAPLIVISSGDEDALCDDLSFLTRHVQLGGIHLLGMILNKIKNHEDFRETRLPQIVRMGVKVLGLIPYDKSLPAFTVGALADRLLAKVLTGEEYLNRMTGPLFYRNVEVDAALKDPLFQEPGKVVITGGDREDLIQAALESDTAAMILTHPLPPSPVIIDHAQKKGIPLLTMPAESLEMASQLQGQESLMTKDDKGKIALCEQMIRNHCDLMTLRKAFS